MCYSSTWQRDRLGNVQIFTGGTRYFSKTDAKCIKKVVWDSLRHSPNSMILLTYNVLSGLHKYFCNLFSLFAYSLYAH